jgi:hypothetical protein
MELFITLLSLFSTYFLINVYCTWTQHAKLNCIVRDVKTVDVLRFPDNSVCLCLLSDTVCRP